MSEYAGTAAHITPAELSAEVFTSSTAWVPFSITSNGTSPLFIESISSSVTWAAVYANGPGDTPDYNSALQPGETIDLGVYFIGSSTNGDGTHVGDLVISSNVPGNNLLIPLQIEVAEPNFALIAVPTEMTATTEPTATHLHSVTLRNTLCEPLYYHIDGCICTTNTTTDSPFNCTLSDSSSWVELNSCEGNLTEQGSTTISVDFASPSNTGSLDATIQFIAPAADSVWTIHAFLVVQTSTTHFNASLSSYSVQWAMMAQNLVAGEQFTVILHARDHWSNAISSPMELPVDEAISVVVREVVSPTTSVAGSANNDTGRRRLQSISAQGTIVAEMSMSYSFVLQQQRASGSMPANGTFALDVYCVIDGVELMIQDDVALTQNTGEAPLFQVDSVSCSPPDTYASERGNMCLLAWCLPGKQLSSSSTSCTACQPGKYSSDLGPCIPCPGGRYAPTLETTECEQCAIGTVSASDFRTCTVCAMSEGFTSSADGLECVCATGRYSLAEFDNNSMHIACTPCSTLEGAKLESAKYNGRPTQWDDPKVCPGGPVSSAFICPLEGIWIDVDEDRNNSVSLFPCEGANHCQIQHGCSESQAHAQCGPYHTGFLCAQCVVGAAKVASRCSPCNGIQWQTVLANLASIIAMAAWMLKKSVKVVCPPSHARLIFAAADLDGGGTLDRDEIKDLLSRMGDPMASKRVESTMCKMAGPGESHVSMDQFINWCRVRQPSGSTSVVIFFVQTAGLIGSHSGISLRAFSIFNLDASEALELCLAPNLPVSMPLLMPLFTATGIAMVLIITYAVVKARTQIVLSQHHLTRCMVNLSLFTYAPLTQGCLKLLICRPMHGTYYLGVDMSVECFVGDHVHAVVAAVVALLIVAIGLPIFMIHKVRSLTSKEAMSNQASTALSPSGWDVLMKTTRPEASSWFAFMMLLKLGINSLVLFGQYFDFAWGRYLQIVLIFGGLAAFAARPFVLE
eukprot:COSAG05_NODE_1336_length_5147_cov_80.325674_2_plen_969_part_00